MCAFLSYQRPANAKVKQKEDIADLLWVYPENPTVLDICPQGKGLPDVFVPFPTLHTVLRSVLIIYHTFQNSQSSVTTLICMLVMTIVSGHKGSVKTWNTGEKKNRKQRKIGFDLRQKWAYVDRSLKRSNRQPADITQAGNRSQSQHVSVPLDAQTQEVRPP